jgi:hypothetical protein
MEQRGTISSRKTEQDNNLDFTVKITRSLNPSPVKEDNTLVEQAPPPLILSKKFPTLPLKESALPLPFLSSSSLSSESSEEVFSSFSSQKRESVELKTTPLRVDIPPTTKNISLIRKDIPPPETKTVVHVKNLVYTPPVKNLVYTPPVKNLVYTPPVKNLVFTSPVKNLVYTPPVKNLVYTPPVKNLVYTPPVFTPTVKSPVFTQPVFTPPVKSPVFTPPVKSPVFTPPVKSPVFTPPVKSPVFTPPVFATPIKSVAKTGMLSEEEKAKYIAMNKLLKKYETGHHPTYIPLPYAAGKNIIQSSCSTVDQLTPFGRAGLLPFARRGDQVIVFFNLFRGTDRGVKVMELSDLGGRVEDGENFVRGACQEAYEETLGIFNFLGQESNLRKLSQVSYNEDRSVITMAVPITLDVDPLDLVTLYSQVKKDINGPPLTLDLLPPKNLQPRHILNRHYGLSTPKLGFAAQPTRVKDIRHPSKKRSPRKGLSDYLLEEPSPRRELPSLRRDLSPLTSEEEKSPREEEKKVSSIGEEVDGDKIERKSKFNANETADLVFLTVNEIKTLLAGKECPMSDEMDTATRHTYVKFPPLYFAIAKHLSALLPFMETYTPV